MHQLRLWQMPVMKQDVYTLLLEDTASTDGEGWGSQPGFRVGARTGWEPLIHQ